MEITDNARVVLERRIGARDEQGNSVESAEDIFRRVARNIAEAERNYCKFKEEADQKVEEAEEKFYELMSSMTFLPNSPTLVNAGRELQQLSACFVLPVEDSMEGIFESVKQAALIHKTGGGTGFSFSRLRGEASNVSKTSGIASGPVSFMQVFDKATEVIKQGGTRRGANMGILRIDHPDILKFIHVKDDLTKLNNFNISVAITDEFMEAFKNGTTYNLYNPKDGSVYGTLDARDVFNQIIKSAHATGDPGVVFIDRINSGKANPVPHRGPIEATNPCGEQPLYPWDSCNLGSINLSKFVNPDRGGSVDLARLGEVVHDCVHFLDNVIDMNNWPNDQIAEVSNSIRRIGLGVMGWADLLIKLRIPYDSDVAIELGAEIMATIQAEADKASIVLGMNRGNFPDFPNSIYSSTFPALRNATRTTIAPTGTISIIAGCSSGIEPLFALKYTRSHYLDKDPNKRHEMVEFHPALAEWLETQDVANQPLPDYLKTAQDIDPISHVRMQAAFQQYTDNAVSKTINFRKDATVEEVEKAYLAAWVTGCSGVTVYRDGSRDQQVLSVKTEQPAQLPEPVRAIDKRKRLDTTRKGIVHKFSVGDFEGYITVGLYGDGAPGEVYIIGNRTGSTTRGYLDTIGLLFSLALQYGAPLDSIVEKLTGTRFEPSGITGSSDIPVATSVVDYIARWLRREFVDKGTSEEYTKQPTGDMCPECDAPLFYGSGCSECISCGYSKCG